MTAIALVLERTVPTVRIPAQFLRYAGVSVAALALDTGAFLALCKLGVVPAAAGGIGYLAGLVLHYVLSIRHVFDAEASGKPHRRLFTEFAASGLAGLALTSIVIALATGGLGLSPLPAKLIAVGLSFVAVYLMRQALVFAAR